MTLQNSDKSTSGPAILIDRCALCGREIPIKKYAEKHHLTTRQRKRRKNGRKDPKSKTVIVCSPCGDQIHQLFTNKELRTKYNTIEALREDPRIQKWIEWIRKTDRWYVCMKTKKARR